MSAIAATIRTRAFVEVYANVLGKPIEIHPSTQATAVGAAVLGMIAAGHEASGFSTVVDAAQAMASVSTQRQIIIKPDIARTLAYQYLYDRYRKLASMIETL